LNNELIIASVIFGEYIFLILSRLVLGVLNSPSRGIIDFLEREPPFRLLARERAVRSSYSTTSTYYTLRERYGDRGGSVVLVTIFSFFSIQNGPVFARPGESCERCKTMATCARPIIHFLKSRDLRISRNVNLEIYCRNKYVCRQAGEAADFSAWDRSISPHEDAWRALSAFARDYEL